MCPDLDKQENEKAQAILKALEDAIANEVWDKSNFLKAIGKELVKIHDSLVKFMQSKETSTAPINKTISGVSRNDHQEVFISLYSSEGRHLQSWERIITNLPRQMISRPIYTNEADVQAWIKHKENKLNEAYVCILVNTAHLLEVAEDKKPKDKFGKPLLVLKDKSINLDYIQKFVHISGNYEYTQGRLKKM